MGLMSFLRALASALGDDGGIYDMGDGRDRSASQFRYALYSDMARHIEAVPACAAGFDRRRRQTLMMSAPLAGSRDDVWSAIDDLMMTGRCGCGLGFALAMDDRRRRVLRRLG